jgi:hypothetical protein
MRQQNRRKVKWCPERMRAYVLRDGVRYWAPQDTTCSEGEEVGVFNPNTRSLTVRNAWGIRETWRADATSPGSGG